MKSLNSAQKPLTTYKGSKMDKQNQMNIHPLTGERYLNDIFNKIAFERCDPIAHIDVAINLAADLRKLAENTKTLKEYGLI